MEVKNFFKQNKKKIKKRNTHHTLHFGQIWNCVVVFHQLIATSAVLLCINLFSAARNASIIFQFLVRNSYGLTEKMEPKSEDLGFFYCCKLIIGDSCKDKFSFVLEVINAILEEVSRIHR